MGRANDSDVRMTDISISRNHANLRLVKGEYYLEDNSSKFGTLAQIQNDIIFLPYKQFALQCGKIYLLFNLKRTFIAWVRCYSNKNLSGIDYNELLKNQAFVFYKEEMDNVGIV